MKEEREERIRQTANGAPGRAAPKLTQRHGRMQMQRLWQQEWQGLDLASASPDTSGNELIKFGKKERSDPSFGFAEGLINSIERRQLLLSNPALFRIAAAVL